MTDWICELTDKERESFLTFAKQSSSPIQIYLYSRFMGYTGSIVDCDEWVKSKFKKRTFAALLEMEIDSMQQDIAKLRDAIDMGIVKQDMGASRIAMMQKELRGSIKQLNDEKVLLDKQGLILAGADRAIREILLIFRDDPIEGPLQEASMGVWTKIFQEES